MAAFTEQVRPQKELLQNSLAQEKRQVIEDVGKYNSKNGDPFYRLAEPKAQIKDTGDHYVIETKIPEHEKDNVKVIVHGDKVIVQGQRRFEDEVDDKDSHIATHNFQSYRQEIPLEHPVREKFIQKNYENGMLKIRIPKA
jgi:HSP20 family molecular chaperone IbpA